MNRARYFWRWDTPKKYQKNIRAYYRMISGVDHVIGRVVKQLADQGLAENTVVIFTGDNGYYAASRGFAGKWSHYEESLRVPLVIFDPRLPKAQRGRVESRMVLNVDVAPTIVSLAGEKIPAGYQGNSLVPLVQGKSPETWRTDFFCEHLFRNSTIPKWEGVRDQRWVYARYFEQKPVYEFLHDLKTDPDQLKNLATDGASAETLARMRKRCDELRDGYGGVFNDENFPRRGQKRKKK
jgi:arylsulfatase A-like enzyme